MKKMLLRKYFNKKVQTIGIVLLVVLWMFVSAFSVNLYITNIEFRENYYKKTNVEDFHFIPRSLDVIDELADKYHFKYEEQYVNDFEDSGKVYRVISENELINIPYIIEGRTIQNENEILINQEYAAANNIKVGNQINLMDDTYTVIGIATSVDYIRMHVRENSYTYDPKVEALIIAQKNVVKNISGGKISLQYNAKYNTNVVEEQTRYSSEMVRSKDIITITLQDDNSNISVYNGKISIYFLLTIISLFVMSIIIVLLLIMFLYIIINEDRNVIGVLSANGMKKSRIFTGYLSSILAILLPAGAVGYLLGYYFAPMLNSLLEKDISLPEVQFKFKILYFGIFMAIVLWVAVLATILGTVGILSTKCIDLLKSNKIKKVSRFEKFVKKVVKTKKIEKKIKISFAIRSKLLLILVLFSVFAAGVEFFLSYSIYMLPSKMKKVQEESMDFESMVYFERSDGKVTESGQYFYQLTGIGVSSKTENVISIYAIEPGELLDLGETSLEKNEAIINRTTADVLSVAQGDIITVEIYDKTIEVKVKAICDRIVGKEVFVDYASLVEAGVIEERYTGMFTNEKSININSYDNIAAVITKDEILKNYESSQETMKYGSIILAILGIVIPVTLIAITVSILISENQREIAIFKANGITSRVMDRMIYGAYNSFLVIGLIISIPYSFIILNIIFAIAVKSSGIKYPTELDIISVIFAVLMTFLVYFGTMFTLKLNNRKNMEKMRYDFG